MRQRSMMRGVSTLPVMPNMIHRRVKASVAVLSIFAIGLVTLSPGPSGAQPSAGSPAPNIGLVSTQGKMIDRLMLEGHVSVIDFWATWCGPCRVALPELDRLSRRYARQGVLVVGVNQDNSPDAMRQFLTVQPLSFHVVHDPQHAVAQRFGARSLPSTYILDRQGTVRFVHHGYSRNMPLDREVASLLP